MEINKMIQLRVFKTNNILEDSFSTQLSGISVFLLFLKVLLIKTNIHISFNSQGYFQKSL